MPYPQQRIPDAIEATDTATDDGRCPTGKGSGLSDPTPAARCPTASRRNAAHPGPRDRGCGPGLLRPRC